MYSDTRPLDIRLKLLVDDNVILGKCDGFETEIFMPSIIDGRITIINVIPQRRCNCISTTHIVGKRKKPCKTLDSPSATLTKWRMSTSSQGSLTRRSKEKDIPLANSTPTQQRILKDSNGCDRPIAPQDYSIPSPQEVRRAILPISETTGFSTPRNQKSSKSLSNVAPLPFTSKTYCKSERYLSKSKSCASNGRQTDTSSSGVSNISNMQYPLTPPNILHNQRDFDLPSTVSPFSMQWNSVLKPKKTYSRQKYSPTKTSTDAKRPSISNFYVTPAKGPKIEKCSGAKKIKFLIDEKKCISPKSYKEQLSPKLQRSSYSLQEELQKRSFEMRKRTAFDLLTMPSTNNGCSSVKLQQQFKKKCVNKASSTFPRYKKLCGLPNENTSNLRTQVLDRLAKERASNKDICPREGFFTPESISCTSGQSSPSISSFQRIQHLLK